MRKKKGQGGREPGRCTEAENWAFWKVTVEVGRLVLFACRRCFARAGCFWPAEKAGLRHCVGTRDHMSVWGAEAAGLAPQS
jgi:hypothetical protein